MRGIAKKLIGVTIIAASVAVIPGAAMLGLLILDIEPNPKHPPGDVWNAALGWAISAAFVGGVGAVIGEGVVMVGEHGPLGLRKGFILGSVVAVAVAAFLGIALAVLQMNTVSGQAITSVGLGVLAGATVATLAAIAGAAGGAIIGRAVSALIA